jgi:undecaprenyl-diphosphatase
MLLLDEKLLVRMTRLRTPATTAVMLAFTRLGAASSWLVIGLFILAVAGPALAVPLSAGALVATLQVQLLKRLLRRARPCRRISGFLPLDPDPDAFSLPSGHTATAFGVALSCLACHSPLAPPALVLATGIAVSRVYLGAHYPLDVAVGALVGGIGALASTLVRL